MLLLAEHEKQVRRQAPYPGVGKSVVTDGPVVRIHAGTHGQVDLVGPLGPDPSGPVRRQQEAFAAHGEPVEWKAYGHDDPALTAALLDHGFTPGWQRPLLIASVDDFRGPVPGDVHDVGIDPHGDHEQARRMARTGGPHRTPLDELDADGTAPYEVCVLARRRAGQVVELGWAHQLGQTEFIEICGLVGEHTTEFLPYWIAWSPRGRYRYLGGNRPEPRFFVAEVDGPSYDVLVAAGFQEVSTVRTYHWSPPDPGPRTRPVRMLIANPEYREIWDAVYEHFSFKPSVHEFPGKVDPSPSMTWHLDVVDDDRLEAIVERGLRAAVRPGELLRFLDWQHVGFEFDPSRVGRAEYPDWPGVAYPDGDYYLNVTPDLRLGTFGHPWEDTLCVFGADLLAVVRDDLTALLGPPIRAS
ncbi:DUF2716 domain-containing protein [Kribbella sp. ALI-6-A]|uniref:DUF2716 domain-containing protein n=1 Tax=Kribbella sp. ALI-6-A TaxID=1933817 RepID=UPI000A071784|nr:DUF2716 domain-containing protein [Kribbella sp. ALI-6-A]